MCHVQTKLLALSNPNETANIVLNLNETANFVLNLNETASFVLNLNETASFVLNPKETEHVSSLNEDADVVLILDGVVATAE